MGYLSIQNLYKCQEVIAKYAEWYALEKIHGTSAHITFNKEIKFSSGGSKHSDFIKIFNQDDIKNKFDDMKIEGKVVVYGEAYGGKLLKMAETYGPELKFVAFDVKVNDKWLTVPEAETFVKKLGLEFVSYKKISSTIKELDEARDEESIQAIRNGMGKGKLREGIVIRPLKEEDNKHDERIIYKHKRTEFSEHKTPKKLGDEIMTSQSAIQIAEDWVTEMRLEHVLDKLKKKKKELSIPNVIDAMVADILREGRGEIDESPTLIKNIKSESANLYKKYQKMHKT
ncbi:MAG: ligase 2 [Edafosvirus sp.]|uniref:Ligase 2 n=1 Tax=Edafosvirus sp. TaxID=2487765 RepID=A0A3G4ZTA0_9VIRU|nr:MAG: ligase 2 [Edafosvirus sp.]